MRGTHPHGRLVRRHERPHTGQVWLVPATPQKQTRSHSDIFREHNYDPVQLCNSVLNNEPELEQDQCYVYDIVASVMDGEGGIFFLDAPGGTGKTFVLSPLVARIRQDQSVALAVTSSGIASTLLQVGRTAHSALQLPMNIMTPANPMHNIKQGMAKG